LGPVDAELSDETADERLVIICRDGSFAVAAFCAGHDVGLRTITRPVCRRDWLRFLLWSSPNERKSEEVRVYLQGGTLSLAGHSGHAFQNCVPATPCRHC
jgi:hypothetical protein